MSKYLAPRTLGLWAPGIRVGTHTVCEFLVPISRCWTEYIALNLHSLVEINGQWSGSLPLDILPCLPYVFPGTGRLEALYPKWT